jgi:Big-like domain-containing protein
VGDTARLRASALDDSGKVLRSQKILWRSSEPAIAQVDAGSGRVRALSPGTVSITARSDSSSAVAPLTVLPAAVAAVEIKGAHPLKAGETLTLRAEPRDAGGGSLSDRAVLWASTDSAVAAVDSVSGVVAARAPGSVRITATSEGRSGSVIVIVVPELRIGRAGPLPEEPAPRAGGSAPEGTGVDPRQQLANQLLAGVEQCYEALRLKDVARVTDLYQPASRADREKLKKLNRILRTQEWAAEVGKLENGTQRLDADSAAMDFTVRLTWKDAFGGRLSSQPAFRVEFARNGSHLDLSSCRLIGDPKL